MEHEAEQRISDYVFRKDAVHCATYVASGPCTAAVSRRTYRAILGFHTQMRLSLSFRHSSPGRQYETIQGSVAPIYLPTFLPSFPRWKSPGRPWMRIKLTHPSSVSRDFEVSKPSFEFRVSTARLSFWATYIAFFIFVQAMLILRLRLSGSAV